MPRRKGPIARKDTRGGRAAARRELGKLSDLVPPFREARARYRIAMGMFYVWLQFAGV